MCLFNLGLKQVQKDKTFIAIIFCIVGDFRNTYLEVEGLLMNKQ